MQSLNSIICFHIDHRILLISVRASIEECLWASLSLLMHLTESGIQFFNKLTHWGVPRYIVKLLSYWSAKQTMWVRWGDRISNPFRGSNGVRQGDILSPYLFNVYAYMDSLSSLLNCCNTGCVSGDAIIYHLMYADDMVLISPSATDTLCLWRL